MPILAVTSSDLLSSFLNFSGLLHHSVLFSGLLLLLPISTLPSFFAILLFLFTFTLLCPFFPLCYSLLLSPLLCSASFMCGGFFCLFCFWFFLYSLTFPALHCSLSTSFGPLVAVCPSPHTNLSLFLPFCHSSPHSALLSCSFLCDKTITVGQVTQLFPFPSLLFLAFLYPSPHLSSPFHLPLASGCLELSLFNFTAFLQSE